MATVNYLVTARNGGTPTPNLSPTWNTLVQAASGAAVSSPNATVPIVGLAGGGYKIAYDPDANGDLYGILDFGGTISDPNERYADIYLSKDSSRLLQLTFDGGSNVKSVVQTYAAGEDPVTLLKADAGYKALIANVVGQYTFTPPGAYPGTGTLVLKDYANQNILATITLTFDAAQRITARAVA